MRVPPAVRVAILALFASFEPALAGDGCSPAYRPEYQGETTFQAEVQRRVYQAIGGSIPGFTRSKNHNSYEEGPCANGVGEPYGVFLQAFYNRDPSLPGDTLLEDGRVLIQVMVNQGGYTTAGCTEVAMEGATFACRLPEAKDSFNIGNEGTHFYFGAWEPGPHGLKNSRIEGHLDEWARVHSIFVAVFCHPSRSEEAIASIDWALLRDMLEKGK